MQTQEEVYISRVQDKEVGLRMSWKSNRHSRGNTMKIEVRGEYSPMEEDFFQQNDFLCEMALQNQFNYCLKIRKLKLRVTI